METQPDLQASVTPLPLEITPKPPTSAFIKFIRIFLLALIVIGIVLLCTINLWVPKLVSVILGPGSSVPVQSSAQVVLPSTPLTDLVGSTTPYTEKGGKIYYNDQEVLGANPKTFHVIVDGTIWEGIDMLDTVDYATDGTNVFAYGKDLAGADASTFEVLKTGSGEYSEYAEDKTHVYDSDQVLDADRATFKVVTQSAAKDKNSAYWGPTKLSIIADPSTFTYSGTVYFKDSQHVYYVAANDPNESINILSGTDLATFTASTFQEVRECEGVKSTACSYDAQDKNHKYEDGQIVQ